MRAAGHPTGFFCKARPVLYSAAGRLAYMKTPKAASLAIQDLFQKQFPDYRWAEARETLPNGTFVFTFVRNPLQRAVSAYAEIDVAYALRASQELRNSMSTTFHHLKRQAGDSPRFLAFVDDLLDHRFGGDDRDHWMPTHAYPQLNFICAHRVDYIGHLENQDADWEEVQTRAGIPLNERTGFPHGHTTTNRTAINASAVAANLSTPTCNRACTLKLSDQQLPADSTHVLQRLCDAFASDFLCLGYPMPDTCAWRGGGAGGTGMTIAAVSLNGTLPLPSLSKAEPSAAPVYIFPNLDASAARHLLRQPLYRNTLFLLPSVLENRSNLYRLKRAMNASFYQPRSEAGLLLREHDRFGWFWHLTQTSASATSDTVVAAAPRATGIPLPVRSDDFADVVEAAIAEAQTLLLLHRYDRVVVAGRGLLTSDDGSPGQHAGRLQDVLARSLVSPIASATRRPSKGTHARSGSPAGVAPSPPHKHFLPGR